MRIFRAPVVALAVLGVVVAGALLDREDEVPAAADAGRAVASSPSPTTTARPVPAPHRTSTTVLPPVTTVPSAGTAIEGDDDPEAIDSRTWTWDQLADCESGAWGADRVPIPGTARWSAVRAIYQGGLQFAAGTWDAYAEPGFPADAHLATREQQIVVAEKVIARQGPRAWPTCGPRLGMVGPDLPLDDPVEPSLPLAVPLP